MIQKIITAVANGAQQVVIGTVAVGLAVSKHVTTIAVGLMMFCGTTANASIDGATHPQQYLLSEHAPAFVRTSEAKRFDGVSMRHQAHGMVVWKSQENIEIIKSDAYSQEFIDALANLEAHGITPSHSRDVANQWKLLERQCRPREPIVQITCEDAVQFAWNKGGYYLDLDIYVDGRMSWFFRDRDNDKADGTDGEPEHALPPKFWERLALASARS